MRTVERVVITGATSFIGSSVAREFLENGCQVFGIVRESSKARHMLPSHPNFHVINGEINEIEEWVSQIGSADTFLHFAWGGPGAAGRADVVVQRQNISDTEQCMRAADRLGVTRFLFAGSQAEYGQTYGQISEDAPCNPILEYGKCKLAVSQSLTQMARELGMEYIHTRIFSVYGKGDHPYTLIPSCIRTFLAGEKMELSSCEQMWNFMHVEDAATAFYKLATCSWDTEDSPIVNVASGDTRVLRSFVEEIYKLTDRKGECLYGARVGGEKPVDNWPCIDKLVRITGWEPRIPFEQGIMELIDNERK